MNHGRVCKESFCGRIIRGVSLGLLFSLAAMTTTHVHAQLSDSAQAQIAEIYAFKQTMTPAEQKMSSNLVLLSREARHLPLGKMAKFINRGTPDEASRITVDVGAELTPSLMASDVMKSIVADNGGEIPQHAFAHKRLGFKVRASQLLALASHPDVKYLNDGDKPTTNVGATTSQGTVAHGTSKAALAGYTGAGVTVGVISDSALPAQVSALIASGDLAANTVVVPGQAGPTTGTNEGAAMMEIVHDMAPSANIVFATAYNTQAQFAANIRTLRYTYHCDIIVDDISYFAEGVFQDGTVAQAVNEVTKDGALYFSAAANSGNLTLGTAGTWEGDFKSGGVLTAGAVYNFEGPVLVHNFSAGKNYDSLTAIGSGVSLKWADKLGGATDDYDLFILDSTGTTVKGYSAGGQTGTQDPFEFVGAGTNCGTTTATGYCGAAGDQVVVVLYSGVPKALHVDTLRGKLNVATTGSTYGHNAAASTFTMASSFWGSAHKGVVAFTGGASNPVETFSSDGPRKIFFNPDGTEITAGNDLFGTGGGVTLQKPDATAADGVSTKTPGFLPFYGTSAAAPHAAAIAALVKGARPSLTNVQIRSILDATALDNMAPGIDRDSGYGILMAMPAIQAALAFQAPSAN